MPSKCTVLRLSNPLSLIQHTKVPPEMCQTTEFHVLQELNAWYDNAWLKLNVSFHYWESFCFMMPHKTKFIPNHTNLRENEAQIQECGCSTVQESRQCKDAKGFQLVAQSCVPEPWWLPNRSLWFLLQIRAEVRYQTQQLSKKHACGLECWMRERPGLSRLRGPNNCNVLQYDKVSIDRYIWEYGKSVDLCFFPWYWAADWSCHRTWHYLPLTDRVQRHQASKRSPFFHCVRCPSQD